MKKFKLAVLFVAFIAVLSGCALFRSPDQTLVSGVEGYVSVILPEYEKYVDNDPALDADSKKIRKDSSVGLKRLLEEAKGKK